MSTADYFHEKKNRNAMANPLLEQEAKFLHIWNRMPIGNLSEILL